MWNEEKEDKELSQIAIAQAKEMGKTDTEIAEMCSSCYEVVEGEKKGEEGEEEDEEEEEPPKAKAKGRPKKASNLNKRKSATPRKAAVKQSGM
jgi:hypothetical protein